MNLYQKLSQDIRFQEGLKACMNCGICTAICPAAEFSDYDPRVLLNQVQMQDNEELELILKSDLIWLCGQCMSCKMRCPRGNFPGLIINVLRKISQEEGYFVESKRGRQQFVIQQVIGKNILKYGYCIHPSIVVPEMHPEQGTVWEWIYENRTEVYKRLGANLDGEGAGVLRKISQETLDELKQIFEITGGIKLFEAIEKFSIAKAERLGYETDEEGLNNYINDIYNF